jgi:hypothetical protein
VRVVYDVAEILRQLDVLPEAGGMEERLNHLGPERPHSVASALKCCSHAVVRRTPDPLVCRVGHASYDEWATLPDRAASSEAL